MPEPDADEDAFVRQMLLSMLTHREPEPVHEQTELERGRAAKAAEMMGSEYWQGAPMYYEPASAFNYTDENVRNQYLQRLAQDARHQSTDPAWEERYRRMWENRNQREPESPSWRFREDTPPRWPE